MKMTPRQAVAVLLRMDREHQYDLGAANGLSRTEVDARIAPQKKMDSGAKDAMMGDLYRGQRGQVVRQGAR